MLSIHKKVYYFSCSGVLLWIRIKKDWRKPWLALRREHWEVEPPTSYSARLARSESCHLLATTTLKIWVVFSWSHRTVSFDSHGSSGTLRARGVRARPKAPAGPSCGVRCGGKALLQEVAGHSEGDKDREITNYSDICSASKGSRRARGSAGSCLIPHHWK